MQKIRKVLLPCPRNTLIRQVQLKTSIALSVIHIIRPYQGISFSF
jgi:hypothetical protein